MARLLDLILLFLRQFAGGPGPVENNLVRFGLPAILLSILLYIAWSRQRTQDLPREKVLVWGFGLGLARELYMLAQMAGRILSGVGREVQCSVVQPLEHALAMAAIVVIAGAFLRYVLDDKHLSARYLQIGVGATAISLLIASWTWPRHLAAYPEIKFHQTWEAWLFHLPLSLLIAVAIVILRRKREWLSSVVTVALAFFFLGEFLTLINYGTNRTYSHILCPIGNSFHIWAIPILGYVYLREQSIEKQRAEEALQAYRDHLEDLVQARTAELTAVNVQLEQEIAERRQAETAIEQLSRRNKLILEAAGEGICGIDRQGRHIFVNPAAARMLGYQVQELLGQPSHATWHHTKADGSPYPESECPIHSGYSQGTFHYGDDQVFWRKDGSRFPARYTSTPIYEQDTLAGAVVVFQDITERKQTEAKIAQHNAHLAVQNAVADTLSQSLDLETILSTALDTVLDLLDIQVGLLFLLAPGSQSLVLHVHRGVSADSQCEPLQDGCACVKISAEAVTRVQAIVLPLTGRAAEHLSPHIAQAGIHVLVSAPLVSKGRAVGALTLGVQRSDPIPQAELELLTAIGQQIGLAVENARLFHRAERWTEDLTLLHQVSTVLTSTLDLDQIYEHIAEQASTLLACQMACVLRLDRGGGALEIISDYGVDAAARTMLAVRLNENGLLDDLAANGGSILLRDARTDPGVSAALHEQLGIETLVCAPISSAENETEYLLLLDQEPARLWGAEEQELVERFVNRAAVALVNANLHQQLEWAAALQERQRIAADMHDGLAQTLSLLGLRVDRAAELTIAGQDQASVEELRGVLETLAQASTEVRHSIASLREGPQPRKSLQDQLSELCQQIVMDGGVSVDLVDHMPGPLFLDPGHRVQVLPIIQEALINALRHARARRIALFMEQRGDRVTITVRDDGQGFNLRASREDAEGHFGLSIMRARAARIGGALQIDTTPGGGTQVSLSWSLDAHPDKAQDHAPPGN